MKEKVIWLYVNSTLNTAMRVNYPTLELLNIIQKNIAAFCEKPVIPSPSCSRGERYLCMHRM